MNNPQKSKMWARRCFLATVCEVAFCLIGVLFSASAPPPETPVAFGWFKVGLCVFTIGTSLIPFYRRMALGGPERVDARRYIGFGFGLSGLTDLIRSEWSRAWHAWLWPFEFAFVVFFVIALFYHAQDPDDKPRKRRKMKAKWPSWAKRWARLPRHHRPPEPHPQPSPTR